MAKRIEFVDYLLELPAPMGGISARAMFGGHGVYRDDLIFGIVIDDVFYLKADEVNRGEFAARGLGQLMHESKNSEKKVAMSYRQCPEAAIESASSMGVQARGAMAAAMRAAAKKTVKEARLNPR
jgi:DNA transformation protein